MFDTSRRTALRCGLAGLAVLTLPAQALASAALPTGSMLLRRRLERGLSDGKAITVERHWAVQFTAGARGITVSGEQVAVSVEAPEKLAQLAAIEEQRDTSNMFPILLSDSGEISGVGAIDDRSVVVEAVKVAEALITRAGGTAADHRQHLAAIQAAGAQLLETMPRDLLYPKNDAWEESRELPLPDGGSGEIAVRYQARSSDEAPWLDRAERVVTTRVAESSRTSREVWSLGRL